jgi:hypothetical protein
LQTVQTLLFGLQYAGWYLQLYNVKPTQVCSVQSGRQVIYKSKGDTSQGIGNLNSAFEITRLPTGQKAYRQSVSQNCATNITSQLQFVPYLPEETDLLQWTASRDTNSKTTRDATSVRPYQKYLNLSGDPVPLNTRMERW